MICDLFRLLNTSAMFGKCSKSGGSVNAGRVVEETPSEWVVVTLYKTSKFDKYKAGLRR